MNEPSGHPNRHTRPEAQVVGSRDRQRCSPYGAAPQRTPSCHGDNQHAENGLPATMNPAIRSSSSRDGPKSIPEASRLWRSESPLSHTAREKNAEADTSPV